MTQAGIYYTDDLTTRAEESVERLIAFHIDLEKRKWDSQVTAEKIKENLANMRNSMETSSFLWRYLKTHWSKIANTKVCDAITWGEKDEISNAIINDVSGILFRLNEDIKKVQWIGWLRGDGVPRRDLIFKIAIMFKMSVEDTIKLLLISGCETYSFRDPRDLICWYYQQTQKEYTWLDVKRLLDEFKCRATPNAQRVAGLVKPTDGGTRLIETAVDSIINKPSAINPDERLVTYMVEHSQEFITFPAKKEGCAPLPGYSCDKMNKMIRLSLCLEKIYPYSDRLKDMSNDFARPVLPEVVSTMFERAGWTKIDWEKAAEGETNLALESLRKVFCKKYKNHIRAVQRMRTEGNTVEFFNRRDALLFIFFLISGYIANGNDHEYKEAIRKDILQMLQPEDDFDYEIGRSLAKALAAHDGEMNEQDRFEMYRESFNFILAKLGYHRIYMPSVLDRFFLLALMSDNPAKLAAMIMGQVVDPDSSDTALIDLLKIPADLEQRLAQCRRNKDITERKGRRKEKSSVGQVHRGDQNSLSGSQSDMELLKDFVMPELRAGDPYAMYRAEIKDIPILTKEQEIALFQLVAQGNTKARNKIVEHNLRLVADIAGKYYGCGVDLLDLIQEGNKKLMEAVDKFDLSEGKRFSTYAYSGIDGAIKRAINEYSHTIHIPEEQLGRMRNIRKFEGEFVEKFGRSPTMSEISKELHLSENQIVAAKSSCPSVLSLDESYSTEDDAYSLDQIVADPSISSPDELIACKEIEHNLSSLLDSLDERLALVLKLLYELYDGYRYSESDLAHVFDVDKELVVQIRDSAFAKLRHHSNIKMVKNYYC